jgi:hypothetical protein
MSWDVSGGYNTNAGVIGGPVAADGLDHFATVEDYQAATQKTDQQIVDGIKSLVPNIPWWVWTGLGLVALLALLHELNPTIELVSGVFKK